MNRATKGYSLSLSYFIIYSAGPELEGKGGITECRLAARGNNGAFANRDEIDVPALRHQSAQNCKNRSLFNC